MRQISFNRLLNTGMLLLIPLLTLFGCPADAGNSSGRQSSPLTMTDSTIITQTGASFEIRLTAALGQGYSWQLTDSAWQHIRQTGPQTSEPLPDSKPGSDGVQVFHFKALHTGKEAISFIYVQPFIKPQPANAPRKRYQVQIK